MIRKIFLPLVCLIFLISASSSAFIFVRAKPTGISIIYDTSSEGTTAWGTSVSWNHTLTAESNSVLIAFVIASGNAGANWSTCNWDAAGTPEAMTGLTEYEEGGQFYGKLFYIENPTKTGTAQIGCDTDGTPNAVLGGIAISIYNAEYATNEDGSGSGGNTASHSDTLTTNTNNSWVVVGSWHFDAEGIQPSQGETEREEQQFNSTDVMIVATELIASAGAETFGAEHEAGVTNDNWIINMAEFKPK